MSELPDEVRAALDEIGGGGRWLLRELHKRGLILWASELRDEAARQRVLASLPVREETT